MHFNGLYIQPLFIFCNICRIIYNILIMKKFTSVLILMVLSIVSCNGDKKDFTEEYNKMLTESDSIHKTHIQYQKKNEMMMMEHKAIVEEIQNVEVKDSTVFENLAQHEVIIKKHEGMLKSHEILLEGHEELRANFGNLTPDEMKAQISEMKEVHKKIKEEHSIMRQEHERLMQEHENIRTKFKDIKPEDETRKDQ